jgi:hypothetical protein
VRSADQYRRGRSRRKRRSERVEERPAGAEEVMGTGIREGVGDKKRRGEEKQGALWFMASP